MKKVKYICKKCGWTAELPEQWSDLKPKRCGNKKCKTFFLLEKEALEIVIPEEKVIEENE